MPLDVNTTLATGRLYAGLSPTVKRKVYAALLCQIVKTYVPTFNCGTVANGCVSCLSPRKLAFLQDQLLCLLNRVTTPTFGCTPETLALANPCVGCQEPGVLLTLATTLASQSFLTLNAAANLNPSFLLDSNPCIACLSDQPLEVEIALLLMAWLSQFQTVNLTAILAQCDCISSMPGSYGAFAVHQLTTLALTPPSSAPVIPTTGLLAQWEADTLVLNDGDPVTTWNDSSVNARNATQAGATQKPLFKTNIFGTKPALLFDGSNDQLGFTGTAIGAFTAFSVIIPLASGSNYSIGHLTWGDVTNTKGFMLNGEGSGSFFAHCTIRSGGAEVFNKKGVSITASTKHLLTWTFDNVATVVGRNNGVNSALATADGGFGPMNQGVIGMAFVNFSGYIAAIMVYNSVLSAADITAVETYLNGKYPCF